MTKSVTISLVIACVLLLPTFPAFAGGNELPGYRSFVGGDSKTGGDDPGGVVTFQDTGVIVPDAKLPGYWNRNDKLDHGKYHKLATSPAPRLVRRALPARSSVLLIVADDPRLPDMERMRERLERNGIAVVLLAWGELGGSGADLLAAIDEAYVFVEPSALYVLLLGEAAKAPELSGLEGEVAPDLFLLRVEER